MNVYVKLTVCFDEPFWVCVYERTDGNKLQAARIVFGAEPKDYDVYDFLLNNWRRLRFSPKIDAGKSVSEKINPKRMQRQIQKQVSAVGIGTKAQQAMKLAQEENKVKRKEFGKQQREAEKERKFELRTQKKKEKHKGR